MIRNSPADEATDPTSSEKEKKTTGRADDGGRMRTRAMGAPFTKLERGKKGERRRRAGRRKVTTNHGEIGPGAKTVSKNLPPGQRKKKRRSAGTGRPP